MTGSIQFIARAVIGRGFSASKAEGSLGQRIVARMESIKLPGPIGKIESRVKSAWAKRRQNKEVTRTREANELISMLKARKQEYDDKNASTAKTTWKVSGDLFDTADQRTTLKFVPGHGGTVSEMMANAQGS